MALAVLLLIVAGHVSAASDHYDVCCIGDSITEGAVPSLGGRHPYVDAMATVLSEKWGRPVQVLNAGHGGAGVFMPGHTSHIDLLQSSKSLFMDWHTTCDYVVVMAGINDLLAGGYQAAPIFQRLVDIYTMATKQGKARAVVAIPPLPAPAYANECSERERKRLADLIKATSLAHVWTITPLAHWYDDGLHFTSAGYDEIGKAIAQAVLTY
jgi:lysophospholipase L1-like esterase